MNRKLSTKEFALAAGVKPGTVLRGHCLDGHYCGIKPIKLANRLLLWDLQEVEKLLNPLERLSK